jgi:predicted  nucleic acid-binding Zn-ribbon protein
MAVEEITLSRAYVRGLNDEITALKQRVAQVEQQLAAAKAALDSRRSNE